jgi:nitrous-oxide reductase
MKAIKKIILGLSAGLLLIGCGNNSKDGSSGAMTSSNAEKVYVPPGEHDEFYAFLSGGYSGNLTVYGLPSGRMFKEIPVFSQFPTNGYGYSEETKAMLNTSYGFIPWGDSHHPDISQTNGELDGRWIFINENNTPRIARISLTTFETEEIIEIPNSAGNHASSFVTENTEYIVAGTRFAVPNPQKDMPIDEMKGEFKGPLSFISIDQEHGHMAIDFQLNMPGFNYDLSHPGRDKSHGWFFFTSYNTEEAHSMMEVNASQNDKDFIAAVNWKKIAEYVENGGGTKVAGTYAHNTYDESTMTATTEMKEGVISVDPRDVEGAVYYMPVPKSPHGLDVDPSGQYIIGNGKLSTQLSVYSFEKMMTAIKIKIMMVTLMVSLF